MNQSPAARDRFDVSQLGQSVVPEELEETLRVIAAFARPGLIFGLGIRAVSCRFLGGPQPRDQLRGHQLKVS